MGPNFLAQQSVICFPNMLPFRSTQFKRVQIKARPQTSRKVFVILRCQEYYCQYLFNIALIYPQGAFCLFNYNLSVFVFLTGTLYSYTT